MSLMKKISVIVLCLLVLSPVFAADSTDGKEEAYKVCAKMPYADDSNTCLKIVASANWFSVDALSVCTGLSSYSEWNPCLVNIKDKYFQTSLINTCKRIPYLSSRSDCMKMVANQSANESALAVCNQRTTYDGILSCVQSIIKPYTPPAPTPFPTPIPSPTPVPSLCKKDFVMKEFDVAFEDLGNGKWMQAYQRLYQLKFYLSGCLE